MALTIFAARKKVMRPVCQTASGSRVFSRPILRFWMTGVEPCRGLARQSVGGFTGHCQ